MNSYFSSTWGIEEEEEQAFYFVLYFSGKFKGKTKRGGQGGRILDRLGLGIVQ
jgi:hypothetical protein